MMTTHKEFCCWLSGYLEAHEGGRARGLNPEQVASVRARLDQVLSEPRANRAASVPYGDGVPINGFSPVPVGETAGQAAP